VSVNPTLDAIMAAFGAGYLACRRVGERLRAVMRHIADCRTSALGGHKYVCKKCGLIKIAFNACRDRHCPKCQGRAAAKWVDKMRERILPTHYFHVVFTVPHELNPLMRCNKERCYDILFKASAEALKTVLGDPTYLGGKPAFTSILHTWTQQLDYHVHVHAIVSGGGFSLDGKSWVASSPTFLAPVQVLSREFRKQYVRLLSHAYADKKKPLVFRSNAEHLARPDKFEVLKGWLEHIDWVVYAKKPLRGPIAVCKYFAGYTHRVGISNKRILRVEGDRVVFLARHRDKKGRYLGMRERSLHVHEFIRRFLMHVLPRGYTRIRHYGITAPGKIKEQVPFASQLIKEAHADVEPEPEEKREPPPDPSVCPECGGMMLLVGLVDPVRRDPFDTS
jgi:hypothetical protein